MKSIKSASKYQQALCYTHLVSNGIPYEDLKRPIIGIVNSYNEVVPGHVTLRQIADKVKNGVRMAGGLPLEFNTIAVCDGMAQGHVGMKYPLPSREVIADSIEVMVRAHGIFDGLVFITGCDKITPAMLMAASRLDIPSIFINGGPSLSFGSGAERKELRKKYLSGEIGDQALTEGQLCFYSTPGVCPFFGTAMTMLVATEALGMSFPGSALLPAGSGERLIMAERTGRQILDLVESNLTPSAIMTKEAFLNAARVVIALGGSLNAMLHLPAIAWELGMELKWEEFDKISQETPLVSNLIPNGPYTVVDLHFAGGIPAVMKVLKEQLYSNVSNVSLRPLTEIIEKAEVLDDEILRTLDNPVRPQGGVAVLQGNLAKEGAIVKQSAVPDRLYRFSGKAMVFECEEDCTDAIQQKRVPKGTVLVIRNEGPKGGPGMREMHRITEMISLLEDVAIVTDGRFSGASAGLAVGYVSPEAQLGGNIGLVQDGDEVLIDITNRRLELLVDESVLEQRRRNRAKTFGQSDVNGYLARYSNQVLPSYRGAVLKGNKD